MSADTWLEYLFKKGKFSAEELKAAGKDIAVKEKILASIPKEDLYRLQAQYYGLEEKKQLRVQDIPPSLLKLFSYSLAKRLQALPLSKEGDTILLAISEPLNLEALESARLLFRSDVKSCYVSSPRLLASIDAAYHREKSDVFLDEEEDYDLLEEKMDAPIIRYFDTLLSEALRRGASDLHIEPHQGHLALRLRIDGLLYECPPPPREFRHQLIARIKVMAKLDIAEKRLPQDGRMRLSLGQKEIDFRVSTLPLVEGERLVLRILDQTAKLLDFEQLGMSSSLRNKLYPLAKRSEGMILVTGPTGSGKTSTLYSVLKKIQSSHINMMTIEDPVEYSLEAVAQMSVRPKIGLSFAKGLRHLLRQDPDVIMIGEIRDRETAEIATRAALTGHLVMSTLHTQDASSAITRLVDMGIEAHLLVSTVLGVLAQRLLRRLCPDCRESYKPNREEWSYLGLSKDDEDSFLFYRAKGCESCGGLGYRGRKAVFELMLMTPSIQKLLLEKKDALSLRQLVVEEGMETLLTAAAKLVKEGITSFEEVLRVI